MRPAVQRGFTLVEMVVVLAVAAIVFALAWPPLHEQLNRGRRADGIAALMRVQIAQESYRAHHGVYAGQLSALGRAGVSFSGEGLYRIELHGDGAARYRVSAKAQAGRAQAGDSLCPVLSLHVDDGRAEQLPSRRCWNR